MLVGSRAGGAEFGSVGATFGAKTHTLTEAQMPAHSHSATVSPWSAFSEAVGANWDLRFGDGNRLSFQRWAYLSTVIGSTGGSQPHNIVQPSRSATLVIKT